MGLSEILITFSAILLFLAICGVMTVIGICIIQAVFNPMQRIASVSFILITVLSIVFVEMAFLNVVYALLVLRNFVTFLCGLFIAFVGYILGSDYKNPMWSAVKVFGSGTMALSMMVVFWEFLLR